MFYDYLAVALISLGVGDFLWGLIDDSSAEADETATPEPEINPDAGDLTAKPEGDSGAEDVAYVSTATTVTVETDGETETSIFEDIDYGVAPTVSGSDFRDIISASDQSGLEINLDAGAGDDFTSFRFGASVIPGEGSDIMSLSVTQNALASDNGAGVIDMTDANDSLDVTFEDTTPEFMHTVRGQSIEVVDGVTVQTDWIDYYVSDSADLGTATLDDNDLYGPETATRVFRVVIGEGTAAAPADPNTDPSISINRDIATTINATTDIS